MKKSIFKPIIAGVLAGAALFFMPFFLLRVFAFFLIAGAFFRFFIGRRMRKHGFDIRPAFADRIRSMSDEEYNQFKQQSQQRCSNWHSHAETASTK
jgi:hypothetical protein